MIELKDLSTYFKGPMDKALSVLGNELKQVFSNRLLEYQVEEYKRNFYTKTILHRSEPKTLTEFYQPLSIKEAKIRSTAKKISTASARSLFGKNKYITIIGSAGSGKSTIVRYLYTNCFSENYKIPIKVELRYLNEYKGSIADYIFNEIFHFQKLGISNDLIDRMLSADSFVFFFDGYDELSSGIKFKATNDIDAFVKKYPGNKYVITSRPNTTVDLIPLFKNFYVCDLETEEVAEFVKRQIPESELELANKIITAIGKTENRSYRSFLSNPLLLSMFILTFQSYSDIPQRRSEFYHQVFDTLFSIHDSVSKLAYVREKISGLGKDQIEDVLQLFSFLSFFEEKFIFSLPYLEEKLDLIKSKKRQLVFDNDKFLEDLQVSIGVLNKEGLDFAFPHRSLQEYFAALYISRLSTQNKKSLYGKLLKDTESNIFSLIDREHFYRLLVELDYNYLYTELIVPYLEMIHAELVKKDSISDELAYRCYGEIFLTYHVCISPNPTFQNIAKSMLNPGIKYRYYNTFGRKSSKLPKGMLEQAKADMDFDLLHQVVSKYRDHGQYIINQMTQTVKEWEKSDGEIINMV